MNVSKFGFRDTFQFDTYFWTSSSFIRYCVLKGNYRHIRDQPFVSRDTVTVVGFFVCFFYYGLNWTTICAFSLWNCDNFKSFFSLLSVDCVFIHNNAFFFFPVESLFITSLLSYNFAFFVLCISSLEQILLVWLDVLKALTSPSSKTCCYTLKFYLASLRLLSLPLVYFFKVEL